MKHHKYKIVKDTYIVDLEEKVEQLLNVGWSLVGGVSSSFDQYGITFYQALTITLEEKQ